MNKREQKRFTRIMKDIEELYPKYPDIELDQINSILAIFKDKSDKPSRQVYHLFKDHLEMKKLEEKLFK